MKYLALLLFVCLCPDAYGRKPGGPKPSTVELHVFYLDFRTAAAIRSSSPGAVIDQCRWSRISDMQPGIGLSYLKGITGYVDLAGILNGSYVDYLHQDSTTSGSSRFLLDIAATAQLKPLSDRYAVVPYILAGLGYSYYQGASGLYLPFGAGLQFNVGRGTLVFLNIQYRAPLADVVTDHFRYGVGIATAVGKVKVKQPGPAEMPVAPAPPVIPARNVLITATDEATGQPLPYVEVVLHGPGGKTLTGTTDAGGHAVFNGLSPADYTVTGMLNGVNTTGGSILISAFGTDSSAIGVAISHNDPRFTLTGNAVNKTTGQPEEGVSVSVTNETRSSLTTRSSAAGSGSFRAQLESESDFLVVGKKASYMSNIERVSTKGLKRSAILYVTLELLVEEASAGKSIVLSNIYYDKGSAMIRSAASSDLEKLAQFLTDNPGIGIEIASYTDARGSDAANLKLSRARAEAVAGYLIKKGIASERLIPRGYGETKPVNGCVDGVPCSEEAHQQNRRTEFRLAE